MDFIRSRWATALATLLLVSGCESAGDDPAPDVAAFAVDTGRELIDRGIPDGGAGGDGGAGAEGGQGGAGAEGGQGGAGAEGGQGGAGAEGGQGGVGGQGGDGGEGGDGGDGGAVPGCAPEGFEAPCNLPGCVGGGRIRCENGAWGECRTVDEICDRADNDCDGVVDESFADVGEDCFVGVGACRGRGRNVCADDGQTVRCTAAASEPGEEVCDQVDNDCDGVVDEVVGAACYTGPPGTEGVAGCRGGVLGCGEDGEACVDQVLPALEACDEADNDCDGVVDEGDACVVCGDGRVEGSEVCDDGNLLAGDGCSPGCRIEPPIGSNFMLCGESQRPVAGFVSPDDGLEFIRGCAPNAMTVTMLVSRSGQPDGPVFRAFLERGGAIVTEFNNSDDVWNAVFPDEPVMQGARNGACADNINPVVRYREDDPFWVANGALPLQDPAQTGCGHDIGQFPGIIPLGGPEEGMVTLAYRAVGPGRLWLVDRDWQDNEQQDGYWNEASQQLMRYIILSGSLVVDEGAVRLAEGPRAGQGRVEIFLEGAWGTVCEGGWGLEDAEVTCRQLGFRGAEAALDQQGAGDGEPALHAVACEGDEPRLSACPAGAPAACEAGATAGVVCFVGAGSAGAGCRLDRHCDGDLICFEDACRPPEALRRVLLLCGESARAPETFLDADDALVVQAGCVPDRQVKAMLVTREAGDAIDPEGLRAYLQAGGRVLTEYGVSDEIYNTVFQTEVVQGAEHGDCSDDVNPPVRHNEDDPLWAALADLPRHAGATGCGFDLRGWGEPIVELGGWDADTASLAYRPFGSGVLWLVESDWQDGDETFTEGSRQLMRAMVLGVVPPEGAADCARNPLWQPVVCVTAQYVWSSDAAQQMLDQAEAALTLFTGCVHAGDNPDGLCSLDGRGWVSVQRWSMAGCAGGWWHIGGAFSGGCGGHDGDTVRRLATIDQGCYDYRELPPPGPPLP